MICNSSLTIYHKGFDDENKVETWERFNYDNVWFFGGKGAGINKGYDNANDVNVRLPYDKNEDLDIKNIIIGDVIVQGTLDIDIDDPSDLLKQGYETYTITSINNNNFGNNPHIHIGGK